MFWNVLRLESRKTFQRSLFWISVVVLAVLLGFFYSMFYAFRGNIPPSGTQFLVWPFGLIYALGYAAGYASWTSYGTYLLIILVGVVISQEYSWRTMQLWLSHAVPRSLLLGVKFLLSLVLALLIVFVCLLVVGGLSAFFSFQLRGTLNSSSVDYAQLFLSYLRTTYAMLPYAALTFLLAVGSRSTALAVGGGIAFVAVGETALGNLLPLLGKPFARLVQYLPSGLSAALNSQNYALAKMAIPHNPLQPTAGVAILGIAIYTVAFGSLAMWVFRRQNLAH